MKQKGFTLIELLIVIAVIAILIGIALPRFKGMRDEGNYAKSLGELKSLQTAVESYFIHNGSYPATGTSWQSSITGATPKLIGTALNDPFAASGTQYVISKSPNGNFYVVYSVGFGGSGSATIDNSGTITATSSPIFVSNASES